jgi:hypothetical protein
MQDKPKETLQLSAVTPEQAAKILATAYRRRIDVDQVLQVVEEAEILRADGTFSLFEYVAYLAVAISGGRQEAADDV